jgi:hypothetical protein
VVSRSGQRRAQKNAKRQQRKKRQRSIPGVKERQGLALHNSKGFTVINELTSEQAFIPWSRMNALPRLRKYVSEQLAYDPEQMSQPIPIFSQVGYDSLVQGGE